MGGAVDNGGMSNGNMGTVISPMPTQGSGQQPGQPMFPGMGLPPAQQPQGPQYGQPGFGMHHQPGQWQNRPDNMGKPMQPGQQPNIGIAGIKPFGGPMQPGQMPTGMTPQTMDQIKQMMQGLNSTQPQVLPGATNPSQAYANIPPNAGMTPSAAQTGLAGLGQAPAVAQGLGTLPSNLPAKFYQ